MKCQWHCRSVNLLYFRTLHACMRSTMGCLIRSLALIPCQMVKIELTKFLQISSIFCDRERKSTMVSCWAWISSMIHRKKRALLMEPWRSSNTHTQLDFAALIVMQLYLDVFHCCRSRFITFAVLLVF